MTGFTRWLLADRTRCASGLEIRATAAAQKFQRTVLATLMQVVLNHFLTNKLQTRLEIEGSRQGYGAV